MALPVIYKALVESAGVELVKKGVASVMAKMPWAKDARKANIVERKIQLLVEAASDLARNLVPEAVDAQLERLLNDFHADLVAEGISAEDATLVKDSVRAQLRTSVLLPLQDLGRVQRRLENLEKESLEHRGQVEALEKRFDEVESENRALRSRGVLFQTLLAAAVTFSLIAFLLTLVSLLRS